MIRLALLALLLFPTALFAGDYTFSGKYYWKAGQPYQRRTITKYRKIRVRDYYGRYSTRTESYVDYEYYPVTIKVNEHDSIESLWHKGLDIQRERQRYIFGERKKAVIHHYAKEMAQTLNIPLESPNVPQINYGFGSPYGGYALNQGATSALGYSPVSLAQTSTTQTRSVWNPDLEPLLVNSYANAVKDSQASNDAAVQGLGSLAQLRIQGSERVETRRLQAIERLEMTTREAQKLMAGLDKLSGVIEASKSQSVEETTTTTTQQPAPDAQTSQRPVGNSMLSAKCISCHSGGSPAGGLDLSTEFFTAETAKKARWAARLGAGQVDAETLKLLGFSTDPNDANHLPAMPLDPGGGKVAPLSADELQQLNIEIEAKTQ